MPSALSYFSVDQIEAMSRFERANFINALSGFKSTHLIGTCNAEGLPNLGLFHNVVHLGADPALIGYINRPIAAAPHTLANIEATGSYTMNAVSQAWVEKAHQCSARYPEGVSEFEAVGLRAEYRPGVAAPFVAESPLQYALELVEVAPIRHNGTFLVIGRLVGVWLQPDLVAEDGFIHLEKAGIVTTAGIDAYYTTQLLQRFPYAKP